MLLRFLPLLLHGSSSSFWSKRKQSTLKKCPENKATNHFHITTYQFRSLADFFFQFSGATVSPAFFLLKHPAWLVHYVNINKVVNVVNLCTPEKKKLKYTPSVEMPKWKKNTCKTKFQRHKYRSKRERVCVRDYHHGENIKWDLRHGPIAIKQNNKNKEKTKRKIKCTRHHSWHHRNWKKWPARNKLQSWGGREREREWKNVVMHFWQKT